MIFESPDFWWIAGGFGAIAFVVLALCAVEIIGEDFMRQHKDPPRWPGEN